MTMRNNNKHDKSKGKTNPKSKRKRIRNIILIFFICVEIVAMVNIVKIIRGYYKDQSSYDKIAEMVNATEFTGVIDFDELAKVNSDIVAWIYLEDSKINYPVVQGSDNDTYLKTKFDGSYGGAGTIFADYRINQPFEEFYTMLYGHHMRDGSMFAVLKHYKDSDYVKKHGRLEVITPTAKYHMDVVGFIQCKDDSDLYVMNQSATTYDKLIRSSLKYGTDVEWTTDDKLVLLSTCAYDYDNARYILVGKLVPWTEDEIKKAEFAQIKLNNQKNN